MSNSLPRAKQVAVVEIRSTERLTGVHRHTICKLLVRVGEGCAKMLDERVVNLGSEQLQLDELWSFVGKKQRNVNAEDADGIGDAWDYVAIDSDTKLFPSFLVGKRTARNTNEFVRDVESRLRNRVQISTDGMRMYVDAIAAAFGAHGVDYAQIVKSYEADPIGEGRYSPPRVTSTEKTPIFGAPIAEDVSTSYVERRNLTPPHVDAPLNASDQRVQQEAGEPLRGRRTPRRALQLRPPSLDAAHQARDGGRCREGHVER